MTGPRYLELAQELAVVDAEYQTKRQRLAEAMRQSIDDLVTTFQKDTEVTEPKKERKKRDNQSVSGKKTIKEHLLEIIRRHKEGVSLIPIVTAMKEKKDSGEWSTTSEDISTIVSQNLTTLKKEKLLTSYKDEEIHKNVYQAV